MTTHTLWRCPDHGLVADPHGAGECPHVCMSAPQGFCGKELTGPITVIETRRVTLTPAQHRAEESERARAELASRASLPV